MAANMSGTRFNGADDFSRNIAESSRKGTRQVPLILFTAFETRGCDLRQATLPTTYTNQFRVRMYAKCIAKGAIVKIFALKIRRNSRKSLMSKAATFSVSAFDLS